MYKIVRKKELNSAVTLMEVEAPEIAKACKPGQFVILRVDSTGERFPLTIADSDPEKGTVTVIFQVVGRSTRKLNALEEGDAILDFAGPLGRPSKLDGLKRVCLVVGGVGSAAGYPLAKELRRLGTKVDTVAGFRTKELVILEDEYKKVSDLYLLTDDGSAGKKGIVTDRLKKLLENNAYDLVIAVGPLVMMRAVAEMCKEFNQKAVVSMNPIMIDGTGMCGGCRVTVNGEIKFACVDGPEFDAAGVDFDEALQRAKMYRKEEREEDCKLL
ncbi:MAG TPA: sulfide/dihydroorotate dehydrogenase-like FAD/NAD-binding protein [Acholeplasmataceae bacterium]|jgi:ferredoxin--NADP+ reductase|nr:sulfide/dihydroorotate dehydrogenase-like FAD/NAD-binding protein [Acholeplasmataceae bacterium]